MKRLSSPKSWKIKRKGITFITRPLPGAHSFDEGTSLSSILKYILKKAKTTDEVKKILHNNTININGRRIKEKKYLVGLMDVIEIVESKEHFRMLFNHKGEIIAAPIDANDAKMKLCKIIGKSLLKGSKMQLNLFDGRNILINKDDYKVGDTVMLSLPDNGVKAHFKLENEACIYLTGGKYVGRIASIDTIREDKIICRIGDDTVETLKRFSFVVGKGTPSLNMGKITAKNEQDAKH